MSNSRARAAWGSSSGPQPASTRRASSEAGIVSISSPVSARTRSRKWPQLLARRHASVATARRWSTRRLRTFCAQTARAAMVRSIAASESAPVRASPSPRRTMREKASSTRNPRKPAARREAGNCWCRDPARHRRPSARVVALLESLRLTLSLGRQDIRPRRFQEAQAWKLFPDGISCARSRAHADRGRASPVTAPIRSWGSSNGRTADSDSASLGSNPSPQPISAKQSTKSGCPAPFGLATGFARPVPANSTTFLQTGRRNGFHGSD